MHHKTYANLGNENVRDLQVLCADCHGLKHENKYKAMDQMSIEFRAVVGR